MDYFATIRATILAKVNSKILKATYLSGVDDDDDDDDGMAPACCNIICAISGSIVVGSYR